MSAETFQLFLVVFSTVLGITSGIIVFYLYSLRGDHKGLADKINNTKDKMHNLEKGLPEKYVMREDYIRTMASFQNKLDKTYDLVSKGTK
jgi:hypothetical protein